MLLFGGGAPSTPRTRETVRLRPRPRLRARAKDRSLDRKLLSLRYDPKQHSTLLWPPVTCNDFCIRQELACYTAAYAQQEQQAAGTPTAAGNSGQPQNFNRFQRQQQRLSSTGSRNRGVAGGRPAGQRPEAAAVFGAAAAMQRSAAEQQPPASSRAAPGGGATGQSVK